LKYVYADSWNPYGNYAALGSGTTLKLSNSGFSLLGLIWNMDRYIDMQHLKRKYSASWASMNRNLSKTSSKTVRLGTTHLLFEIVQDLISRDETQVADAILNSTSNPRWQVDERSLDQGIETVRKLPPGLSIENRGGMFALDGSHDGRFYQCWLIDRVMKNGGFWVGQIVNERNDRYLEQTPGTNDTKISDIDTETSARSNSKPRFSVYAQGHQSSLLVRGLLSMLASHVNNIHHELKDKDNLDAESFSLTQGDQVASIAAFLSADPAARSREMFDRRAIFDIDGDVTGSCLVFQPYHMMLESIPRPALRSMSVSWKVERLKGGKTESIESDADGNETNREESFTTHGAVKGMWRYNNSITSHRVRLI
jgi:hypothetical protein